MITPGNQRSFLLCNGNLVFSLILSHTQNFGQRRLLERLYVLVLSQSFVIIDIIVHFPESFPQTAVKIILYSIVTSSW